MKRKLMKLLYCTILPSLKLTLKVVDDHKSQRVAGNRSLTGVIDVLELCPVFHKHHQWPHPRVHCRHTYTIVPFCVYRKRLMGYTHAHTHTRLTALFSGTTQVGRYQKGKPNLDFTEAGDSEWQCHQLGCMQVCTSLQTDNHVSTPPLSFLQAGCPSCCPTNSVKALKETWDTLLLSNKRPFGLLQVAYA